MDRRIRKTKQAIVTAFLELLNEKSDIDKISITDITRRADISRSTFYFHYNGTYELVEEICDSFTNQIYSIIMNAHTDKPGANGYHAMFKELMELFYENRTTTKLLLKSSKGEDLVNKICEDLNQLLTVYFLSKRENYSKDALSTTAILATSGFLAVIKHWADTDFNRSPEEMADITYQSVRAGIRYYLDQE